MIKFIEFDTLKTEGLQTRDGLSLAVVKEYADLMESGQRLPPLSVTKTADGSLYLTDGYHRLAALRRLNRTAGDVEITEGEFTDAIKRALKANATHGLRRSNSDKQNALKLAWQHRQELFGGEPSHEVLAETCAVSKATVRRFREKLSGVLNEHPSNRVGKDGKTYSAPSKAAASGDDALSTDRFGRPIPERLQSAFGSKRFAEVVKAAKALKRELESATEEGDYGFSKLSQSTRISLNNFIEDLKLEAPYCVCPQCGGRGCRACNNVGVQTKLEYERNPEELRRGAGAHA